MIIVTEKITNSKRTYQSHIDDYKTANHKVHKYWLTTDYRWMSFPDKIRQVVKNLMKSWRNEVLNNNRASRLESKELFSK